MVERVLLELLSEQEVLELLFLVSLCFLVAYNVLGIELGELKLLEMVQLFLAQEHVSCVFLGGSPMFSGPIGQFFTDSYLPHDIVGQRKAILVVRLESVSCIIGVFPNLPLFLLLSFKFANNLR